MPNNTDVLSERPSSNLVPSIDFEVIMRGNEAAARIEIATALKNLQQVLNTYITRKGV